MRSAAGTVARRGQPRRTVPPVSWSEVGVDTSYRRARLVTFVSLGIMLVSSVAMPLVGLGTEDRDIWRLLGVVGVVGFTVAFGCVLVEEFRPDRSPRARRVTSAGFAAASVASVPLVGPLGAESGRWESWAWLGAALAGAAPLLVRGVPAAVAMVALTTAVSAAVGWFNGGAVARYVVITAGVGVSLVLVNGLQIWLWRLVVAAQDGQDARARLTATEERLRFARDVHDLLGHDLSVIALKAELAKRLAPVDPVRAGDAAAEIQRLAASAVSQVRQVVHGYRNADLPDQLEAVEQLLTSVGVRCTVRLPDHDLPAQASHLVPVLREAVTNLLRHSRAVHCTIDVNGISERVSMTVTNDGVTDRTPDPYSHGLRGLTDRLAEVGGTLGTEIGNGTFTLTATVPVTA